MDAWHERHFVNLVYRVSSFPSLSYLPRPAPFASQHRVPSSSRLHSFILLAAVRYASINLSHLHYTYIWTLWGEFLICSPISSKYPFHLFDHIVSHFPSSHVSLRPYTCNACFDGSEILVPLSRILWFAFHSYYTPVWDCSVVIVVDPGGLMVMFKYLCNR